MKITGAVLEAIGSPAPWADSRPITVTELELEPPGRRELLVRIEAAGVCHSDLSVVNGTRPRSVPLLLGHEAAGIVEAVEGVEVGDRVALTFMPRCGVCASCLSGGRTPCEPGAAANGDGRLMDGARRIHAGKRVIDHHLGVSGFASHAVVDHRSVVVVADDVPATVAALMSCAVLTGGGAVINAAKVQPGETVAVVGLGGVGLAALLVALSIPDVTVIAIDALPDKLSRALELGATAAHTPTEALELGVQAGAVIEAAGRAAALETAIALTAPGGTTVTVGLPAPDELATISPLALVAQGRSIVGSYLGSSVPSRDIPGFIDLWRAGLLPVEKLMSSTIELTQLNEAMDALASGHELRQMIVFPKPDSPLAKGAT
jgi:alcohol dehydrogenase